MKDTRNYFGMMCLNIAKVLLFSFMIFMFGSCASVKMPVAYIRPASQLLTIRATLKEATETKARVYFRAKAEVYELEYRTKRGSAFFHKYLLNDKIYDELPEGEFVVAIRAVDGGKKSDWKKLSTK